MANANRVIRQNPSKCELALELFYGLSNELGVIKLSSNMLHRRG